MPYLLDVKSAVQENPKAHIHICKPCWVARNEEVLPAIGSVGGMPDYLTHIKQADKHLSF